MTKFLDGPAAGVTLSLKRAPLFIRAVRNPKGEWDALDQLEDEPAKGEEIAVYVIKDVPSYVHLNCGGASKGSGFYAMAEYQYLAKQPSDALMRGNQAWRIWTKMHRYLIPAKVLEDAARRRREQQAAATKGEQG